MVKAIFIGTPAFALPTLRRLLDSSHQVVAVVTQPDRPRGRGRRIGESPVKQLARERGLPILQPHHVKDEKFLAEIAILRPDIGVVAAYGKILPNRLLDTPRLGVINVHPSLLPKYRGAAPVHHAIMAGERKTGVTIIRLIQEMDAGPMLKRRIRPIDPDETSDVVEAELAELGADLLVEAVADLEAGRAVEEEQDHARATFAPRLSQDDGVIDWTATAHVVHNLVRGLHPWPHASSYLDGTRYLIRRSRLLKTPPRHPSNMQPGEILEADGDRLIVAAGAGTALAIVEIQPPDRRALSARAFLAGHRLKPGSIFHPTPP